MSENQQSDKEMEDSVNKIEEKITSGVEKEEGKQNKHEEELQERLHSVDKDLQIAREKLNELRVVRYEENKATQNEMAQLSEQLRQTQRQVGRMQIELKISEEVKGKAIDELDEVQKKLRETSDTNILLQREVNRLEHVVKTIEEDRMTLQGNVSNTSETCQRLRNQKHDLEQRLKHAEEKLFDTITRCEVAEKSTSHALEDVQVAVENKESVKRELDSAVEEMRALSQMVAERSHELERAKSTVEDERQACADLRDEMLALEQHSKDVESKVAEKQCEIHKLERKITVLQEDYSSQKRSWTHDLDAVSGSEAKLRSRADELENQISSIRELNNQLQLEVKGLGSRNQALEQQLVRIEDARSDAEFRLSSLSSVLKRGLGFSDHDRSHGNGEGNQSPEDFLSSEYVERALRDVSELIGSIESQRDEAQHQVKALQRKREDDERRLVEQKDDYNALVERCSATERAKERMETQFDRTQTTIALQEEDLARKEAERKELLRRVADLEKALHVSEMELDDGKQELQRYQSASTKHSDDKRGLRLQLEDAESRCSKTERELRRLSVDFESCCRKNEEVGAENESFRVQLDRMITDNKDLAKRIMTLESRCSSYETDMALQCDGNRNLRDTMRTLENEIEEKYENARDLHDVIKSSKSQLDKLERENNDLNKLLHDSRKERGLESSVAMEKLRDTQRLRSSAEKQAMAKDDELRKINNAYKEQTATLKELLQRVASLQEEKRCLEHRLKPKDKTSVNGARDKYPLRKKQDVAKLKELLEKTENDRTSMERNLIDVAEENMLLDRNLRQARNENSTLRDRLGEAEAIMARNLELPSRRGQQRATLDEQRHRSHDNAGVAPTRDSGMDAKEVTRNPSVSKYSDLSTRLAVGQSMDTLATDARQLRNILDRSLHRLDRNGTRTASPYSSEDEAAYLSPPGKAESFRGTRKPSAYDDINPKTSSDNFRYHDEIARDRRKSKTVRDPSPPSRRNRPTNFSKVRQPAWKS